MDCRGCRTGLIRLDFLHRKGYTYLMETYTNVSVRGSKILFRGYEKSPSGIKRVEREQDFNPTVFVPANGKATDWETLEGEPMVPLTPGDIRDTRHFMEKYNCVKGPNGKPYVQGNFDFVSQFMAQSYPQGVEHDLSCVKVCYLDIETECEDGFPDPNKADQRVRIITLGCSGKYHCFVLGKAVAPIPQASVYEYDSEDEMLESFLDFWKSEGYDIVTGWNIQQFDIPYLVNRIALRLGDKAVSRLSPWKYVRSRSVNMKGKLMEVFDISGISTLDYLDLYRKFTFVTRDSYSLNAIAEVELGESKDSYAEYDKMSDFYKKDFQGFLKYNIKDVQLVERLERKLRLIEMAATLAYSAKVNFNDVFSQVRTWDSIIYHHLNSQKIVVPPKRGGEKSEQFSGAYVKEPLVGAHDWIVSFDLDSLYPHLIMMYNISPETKVGKIAVPPVDEMLDRLKSGGLEFSGYSTAANGVQFRKDIRGFLPHLMDTMYKERKAFKQKMLECRRKLKESGDSLPKSEREALESEAIRCSVFEQVRKVQLNSAFGTIGNEYFRYYDIDIAEAITVSGQLSIRWIEAQLNDFLNKSLKTDRDYVIASDTDSIYLNLSALVEKVYPNPVDRSEKSKIVRYLERVSNEMIQPFINKKYDELTEKMCAYENKMRMKREAIVERGIWKARKMYILSVLMGEDGVLLEKPELKIKGIETARSSTPKIVREGLTESIRIIIDSKTNDPIIDFVERFKERFKGMKPDEVAFPRGCNGVEKYSDGTSIYKESTPIQVRAALLYNHLLHSKKLDRKYPLIKEGDKMRFIYLKKRNPIGENVIGFIGKLPQELGLEKYIDWDAQFEKSYLEPLKSITDIMGWKTEKTLTLESMFE